MKLIIKYNVENVDPKKLLWEIQYGYDIIKERKRKLVKPPYPPKNTVGRRLVPDEILEYGLEDSQLTLYVDLDENIIEDNVADYIWVKYILNLVEMGARILNLDILDYKFKAMPSGLINLFRLTYKGAKGVILKGYSGLTNDWIINTTRKLLNKDCIVIKEDETFVSSRMSLEERLNKMLDDGDFIYVYNSLSVAYPFSNLRDKNPITIPLVPYLATGYHSISEWFNNGHIVWGHRQGYSLLNKYVKKVVYLKLALLAGATLLHIGTPISPHQYMKTKEIIRDLRNIRAFVPVFTGIPNREVEKKLLEIADYNAVLLSPIYWEGCE